MTISNGDVTVFLRSPIAVGLLRCAAVSIIMSAWTKRKPREVLGIASDAAKEQSAEG